MPVKKCSSKGSAGKKFGNKGKCYTGKKSASKAKKQAGAMYANGYKGK